MDFGWAFLVGFDVDVTWAPTALQQVNHGIERA